MNPPPASNSYRRHRFSAEILSHSVWLDYRVALSYRDVEELMAERGVTLSHEAVWYWGRKFGQASANASRRRHPRPGDKWHLDEVFLTINQARHYLWRAVNQGGHVLDILGQRRRDTTAAKPFFRQRLNGFTYVPRVMVTDKLKSYAATERPHDGPLAVATRMGPSHATKLKQLGGSQNRRSSCPLMNSPLHGSMLSTTASIGSIATTLKPTRGGVTSSQARLKTSLT